MSGEYDLMQRQARDELMIDWQYTAQHPGTYEVTASIRCAPLPMGTVWIRFPGNHTIETLGSFVDSRVRRCGVRTAIHNWMIKEFPEVRRIITTSGTEYGLPWLKATGFKKNRTTGDWEFEVKRRRK